MAFNYVSSMIVVLFGAFFGSMGSLFAGLSKEAGFNPFETLFFAGLLILSATIAFDMISNAVLTFCRPSPNNQIAQVAAVPPVQPPANATAALADILGNVDVTTALIPTAPNPPNGAANNNVNNNNPPAAPAPPAPTLADFWNKTHLNYVLTLYNTSPGSLSWLIVRGFTCTLVLISLYFIAFNYGVDVLVIFDTVPVWALFFDTYLLLSDVSPAHYFLTILLIVGAVFIQQPQFLFDYHSTSSSDSSSDNTSDSEDEYYDPVLVTFKTAGGLILTLGCAIMQSLSVASMKYFTQAETLYDPNNITVATNAETISFAGIYTVAINFIIFGIFGSLVFYRELMANVLLYDNVGLTGIVYIGLAAFTWLLMIFSINYGVKRLNVNEVTLLATTQVIWTYLLNNLINNEKPFEHDGVAVVGSILMSIALILAFGKSLWDRCNCMEPTNGIHDQNYWNINNNNNNNINNNGYGALGNGNNWDQQDDWNNGYHSDTRSEKSVESRTTTIYSGEYA